MSPQEVVKVAEVKATSTLSETGTIQARKVDNSHLL
jgi:hypothetical protein